MGWVQPPQLSHPVRGTKFHEVQLKAEGQETLTVKDADLQQAAPPYMCVCRCCVAYTLHMGRTNGGISSWTIASAEMTIVSTRSTPQKAPNMFNDNKKKRPLTPKSMPPAGDEHAKLKT